MRELGVGDVTAKLGRGRDDAGLKDLVKATRSNGATKFILVAGRLLRGCVCIQSAALWSNEYTGTLDSPGGQGESEADP